MRILLSGANGFLGSSLKPRLIAAGHQVHPLIRSSTWPPVAQAGWNPVNGRIDLSPAGPIDAVIHLAGETIAQRWTTSAKARIQSSRIQGTQLLVEALGGLARRPQLLICASAVGFYGHRGNEWLDEQSPAGAGFLAETCQAWETVAAAATRWGIRVIILRLGMVLSAQGGALAQMLAPFRLGLGGTLGQGTQYWSWIALEDTLRAIMHLLGSGSLSGPVNLVSPNPATNLEFTRSLGSILKRPTILSMPGWAVKLVFGHMGQEVLLASTRVRPSRLLELEFRFTFPELEPALAKLLEYSANRKIDY
jgi:uncharacterized protein